MGLLAVLVLAFGPAAGEGATCIVGEPSHPTIQAAVDDASCTEVLLQSTTYVESVVIGRSLTLQGESKSPQGVATFARARRDLPRRPHPGLRRGPAP